MPQIGLFFVQFSKFPFHLKAYENHDPFKHDTDQSIGPYTFYHQQGYKNLRSKISTAKITWCSAGRIQTAVQEDIRQVGRRGVASSSTKTFIVVFQGHSKHFVRDGSVQIQLTQVIGQVSTFLNRGRVTRTHNRGRILI